MPSSLGKILLQAGLSVVVAQTSEWFTQNFKGDARGCRIICRQTPNGLRSCRTRCNRTIEKRATSYDRALQMILREVYLNQTDVDLIRRRRRLQKSEKKIVCRAWKSTVEYKTPPATHYYQKLNPGFPRNREVVYELPDFVYDEVNESSFKEDSGGQVSFVVKAMMVCDSNFKEDAVTQDGKDIPNKIVGLARILNNGVPNKDLKLDCPTKSSDEWQGKKQITRPYPLHPCTAFYTCNYHDSQIIPPLITHCSKNEVYDVTQKGFKCSKNAKCDAQCGYATNTGSDKKEINLGLQSFTANFKPTNIEAFDGFTATAYDQTGEILGVYENKSIPLVLPFDADVLSIVCTPMTVI